MLAKILNDIRLAHPKIADLICTGAGLELMHIDAQIVEYVIKEFLTDGTPILTVFDSFIVQFGQEERLQKVMAEAFKYITELLSVREVKVKDNDNPTYKQAISNRHLDRDYYLDTVRHALYGEATCKGYDRRYDRHLRFFNKEKGNEIRYS